MAKGQFEAAADFFAVKFCQISLQIIRTTKNNNTYKRIPLRGLE